MRPWLSVSTVFMLPPTLALPVWTVAGAGVGVGVVAAVDDEDDDGVVLAVDEDEDEDEDAGAATDVDDEVSEPHAARTAGTATDAKIKLSGLMRLSP